MYRSVIGMQIRAFVLLLVLSAVMLSGCTDNKTIEIKTNNTSIASVNDTGVANVTAHNVTNTSLNETKQNNTNVGEETTVNVSDDDETTGGMNITGSGTPHTYTVRLEYYLSSPNTLEIAPKDTVFWMNFNSPTRLFVLVSDNGLWENKAIGYRESFSYTFNDTGTYNYSILGYSRMNGTIIVK